MVIILSLMSVGYYGSQHLASVFVRSTVHTIRSFRVQLHLCFCS